MHRLHGCGSAAEISFHPQQLNKLTDLEGNTDLRAKAQIFSAFSEI